VFFNSPRVHWIRNALAHAPKGQHTVVAAAIRQAFTQPDRDSPAQPAVSRVTGRAKC
jgi:transposase-like protein